MKLTESERIAKDYFLTLIKEGTQESCEDLLNIDLPSWYNDSKFKRGQKFARDNRFLILNGILPGVVAILSDLRGLKILASTGRSSTKETAGPRYLSTTLHINSWFDDDVTLGSRARSSLDEVRKAHVVNSKAANLKGIGQIKQLELVMVAFGFFGFAFLRPELLGLHFNTEEDREAFIHMWAVLSYMVGVKDKYNMCLLRLDVLEELCRITIRYIFLPYIQVEAPLFRKMVTAMCEGISSYSSMTTYETQIFVAKMYIGVPGYQYHLHMDKEKLSRTCVFTQKDLDICNEILKDHMGEDFIPFTIDVPLYEHKVKKDSEVAKQIVRYANFEEDWINLIDSSRFNELCFKDKNILRFRYWVSELYSYSVFKYLLDLLASAAINKLRKIKENYSVKKNK